MTITPLGRDQDCSLKNREPDVPALLVPGSWMLEQDHRVELYFIFPRICTLSLDGEGVRLCGSWVIVLTHRTTQTQHGYIIRWPAGSGFSSKVIES
ncbi:hypothetical protein STEG23_010876 [Scotinomys teguina]